MIDRETPNTAKNLKDAMVLWSKRLCLIIMGKRQSSEVSSQKSHRLGENTGHKAFLNPIYANPWVVCFYFVVSSVLSHELG